MNTLYGTGDIGMKWCEMTVFGEVFGDTIAWEDKVRRDEFFGPGNRYAFCSFTIIATCHDWFLGEYSNALKPWINKGLDRIQREQ